MKQALTPLLFVVLAAAGFLAGRVTAPHSAERHAERVDTALRSTENALLRRQLDSALLRLDEAEAKLAEAKPSETVRAVVEERQPETAPEPSGPRFVYDGFEKALADSDWKAMGEALHAMGPLLAEFAVAIEKGEPIPPSAGEIQRWNGPLVTEALKLQQADVPGSGANGAFSHPSVIVNLVHATLARAQKPLSPEQEEALREVGLRFVQADRERLAGYAEATPELRKVIDETALKDELYDAIDGLLSAEQREVLHPEATRGYSSMDLFSSGIVWLQFARPIGFSERADLEEKMRANVQGGLELTEESAPLVAALVREWSQSMSDEFLAVPMDATVRNYRLMRRERIQEMAKRQLALAERVLAQLPLSPEQRENVREQTSVVVPYRLPG